MSKFFYFLKLIRLNNLLLIALTQGLVQFFILKEDIVSNFVLLLLVTFFISASGYIINDIFDVKTDRINKKYLIIGNYISARNAIFWYYLFSSIAIILAIYLLYLNKDFYLFIIFLSSVWILWWYSKRYKHSFIIGNFIVSLLTSLCVFNVFLVNVNDDSNDSFILILMFSVFAFLLTFAREIIKDLEDVEGDKLMNSQNIASTLSVTQSKQIVTGILTLFLFLVLIVCYYFLIEITSPKSISIFVYSLLLFIISLLSIFKVSKSEKNEDYSYISSLLKLIMLLGV
ncbi:geranylgeranylglycerol-phosphate geranylgeranyltransferase, partial [Flavobacteriales bacterium]|nr:geranylgeranylglycerol-phosphate geranylgeranyltransferase [Flavobacteriales bacterium]